MALLFLMVFFITSSLGQDLSCPVDMELFILDFESILELQAEAYDIGARPFFSVKLKPNNPEYEYPDTLGAFSGSTTVLHMEAWDSYTIEPTRRGPQFLVKFIVMQTRYARLPVIEFFQKQPRRRLLKKVYFDRFEPDRKDIYTRTIFPTEFSDKHVYNFFEPFYINKIRIAFRTQAGRTDFYVRDLQVGTCIHSKFL